MKTSIIIPNYNGIKFVKPCFDSLLKQTFKDMEIIMVDNASSDGSLEFVRDNYPDVRIISLDENYGFSRAVNEGIKAAKGEFVLLLNNDTVSEADYVEQLTASIERHPKAFSVASKMVQLYHKSLLDSAGDLYTCLGWAVNRGTGRHRTTFNSEDKIFTACAGAAIYRKAVFNEIGLFDESHFAYLEDIDIGYRAKIYGYENWYTPNAVVYHVGSGTSGSKYNSFKVKLSARNSIYLNYKNMPDWQLVLNALPLLTGYVIKFFFFLHKGFAIDYLMGILEGIKNKSNLTRCHAMNPLRHIKIEAELIKNTFIYVTDWINRKTSNYK